MVAKWGRKPEGLNLPKSLPSADSPSNSNERAGRTGRAGATGEAITLIAGIEELEIKNIGKRFKIEFEEREAPSEEDVSNVVGERTTALLEATLRERDTLQVERMERFKPLARSLGEDETRLIAMLLDDFYQQSLSETPEEPKPSRRREPRSDDESRSGGRGSRDRSRRRPPRRRN